jgi:Immunoglobulin I-set domain
VTASNLAGQAECSAQLQMAQTPPSFVNYMDKYHEIDEGETLSIKMKVDGSPIPTVKWFKDGEEIKENNRVRLLSHPDGSIEMSIEKVVPGDCGAYKIVASNKNGERAVLSAVAVTREIIYSFADLLITIDLFSFFSY